MSHNIHTRFLSADELPIPHGNPLMFDPRYTGKRCRCNTCTLAYKRWAMLHPIQSARSVWVKLVASLMCAGAVACFIYSLLPLVVK